MQEFNIDLGTKEIYSLKNQGFDIFNNGSADLQVDSIKLSSNNIIMTYTKTPFNIIMSKSYTLSGYLKIVLFGDSTGIDYIECDVSWLNEFGERQYDKHRYYLNYVGNVNNQYVQLFEIKNVNYIKDIFILKFEFNDIFVNQSYPNIIIKSIDDTDLFIFPKVYRMSDNKIVYVYKENSLANLIINDKIIMNVIFDSPTLDVYKISYRSI